MPNKLQREQYTFSKMAARVMREFRGDARLFIPKMATIMSAPVLEIRLNGMYPGPPIHLVIKNARVIAATPARNPFAGNFYWK